MTARTFALIASFALLVVALVLMAAHTVGPDARDDMTPATAPGSEPAPYLPRGLP